MTTTRGVYRGYVPSTVYNLRSRVLYIILCYSIDQSKNLIWKFTHFQAYHMEMVDNLWMLPLEVENIDIVQLCHSVKLMLTEWCGSRIMYYLTQNYNYSPKNY